MGRATGYGIKDEKMMRYRCRPVSRQLEKRMREKKLSGMEYEGGCGNFNQLPTRPCSWLAAA
jgi:hypothetical protein